MIQTFLHMCINVPDKISAIISTMVVTQVIDRVTYKAKARGFSQKYTNILGHISYILICTEAAHFLHT